MCEFVLGRGGPFEKINIMGGTLLCLYTCVCLEVKKCLLIRLLLTDQGNELNSDTDSYSRNKSNIFICQFYFLINQPK